MAWIFGDSFDFYTAQADAVAGYWDSGSPTNFGFITGRFTGSLALRNLSTGVYLTKASGANDAVHHFICSVDQTAALSGTTLGLYLQLLDGTTNQCCVVFRSDGAMLLTSGSPTGTVLATYTGAVSAQSTWTAFEIEVVINNTTGSITVRKNGNTGAADFTATGLNTRGGTANNYANKLTLGIQGSVNSQFIDDLLWRSDASSVAWLGDIRAQQLMPNGTVSAQFAPAPSLVSVTVGSNTLQARAANAGFMTPFTATCSGTIASGTVSVNIGGTGNMKAAIYDATRTTVLATANAVVNPVAGSNTITFGTPLTVTKGTTYHLAVDQDFSITYNVNSVIGTGFTFTTTYASFPAASPVTSGGTNNVACTLNITPSTNSEFVAEAQQDGTTTYVYDATVGHGDLYSIAALGATPNSIIAVNTRAFMAKSDAGSRSGEVQVKSGATTVTSTPLTLSTNFQWNYRVDQVDPNTSAAWTAAAVNALQIGPVVQA